VSEPKNAVFLSYASEDFAAAQALCAALRAAGIEVWFDQSELRGGDAWDQKIRREIRDCALFIPIISAHTQARLEGYFRREWKLAAARTHDMADDKPFLVPIVVDETKEHDARVPEQFRAVQWTSIAAKGVSSAFVDRVLQLLSPLDSASPMSTRSESKAPTAPGTHAGAVQGTNRDIPVSVLPFINHARTNELDTLAKCIAEDLAGQLACTPGFQVVAQPAAAATAPLNPEDVPRMARALGARYLISGSVRQRDLGGVRVTIQVIAGERAQYLWATQQDLAAARTPGEIDDFVASTSAKIEQQLILAAAKEAQKRSDGLDAWDKMRQALSALFSAGWSEEAVDCSVRLFREAIALDPNLALARAQKALIMALASQWGLLGGDAPREEARADAERALELEPTRSEVLGCAGCALGDLGDRERAQPLLERAIEENPNNAQAWCALGTIQLLRGQFDSGVGSLRHGLRISPTDFRRSLWLTALAGGLTQLEKLDDALVAAEGACRADSKFYPPQIVLALVLMKLGKEAEALKALTEARRIRPRLAIGEVRFWVGTELDGAAASLGL
jgi:TolB-like protein